jgi:uncharacterized protein (DUF433 family)
VTGFAHIDRKHDVLAGRPIVRGTRIAVDLILEKLAAGESTDDLLQDHPALTRESIADALAYAAEVVRKHAKEHPLDQAV